MNVTPFELAADALLPELVTLRRRLHAKPEVGLHLPLTQAAVCEALEGLGLEVSLGRSLSSVTAVLRGSRPGPAVLLRADMDALPVAEATTLPYASQNGAMHACGHDLHVAGLVGAAYLLAQGRDDLAGDVIFMFQPGEEGPGGAAPMLAEGVLEAAGKPVVAAFGIHVLPGPRGTFSTRPGTLMAGSNTLEITVTGRGGHGSDPSSCVDPVPVLLEVAQALQVFASRRFRASDPVVLSITQLSTASAVINVIPGTASLGASVRTLSEESHRRLASELPALVQGIAAAHGCTADVRYASLYPVTVNDRDAASRTLDVLRGAFGADRVRSLDAPLMASEDFSHVLRRVPGAFVFLHASPPELDPADASFNHAPDVLFDDAVLADQARALTLLVKDALRVDE